MEDFLKLFNSFGINNEYPYQGYLSEIFSPSRLWIQLNEDIEFVKLERELDKFYNENDDQPFLKITDYRNLPEFCAIFICQKWHRAKIISSSLKDRSVCIYAIDYGTKGYVNIESLRVLHEQFTTVPVKLLKACLHGIAPAKNRKLFPVDATDFIVNFCYNRPFRFKFVKHHNNAAQPDLEFHEIIACREDGLVLNDCLVQAGYASPIEENTIFSVFYPDFTDLQFEPLYDTYGHRHLYLKKGIDFNAFEEEFIDPKNFTDFYPNKRKYTSELVQLLQNPRYAAIKKCFESIHSISI